MTRVSPQAVNNWRSRFEDFPAPVADLSAGPVFSRAEVRRWLKNLRPELLVPDPTGVKSLHIVRWADMLNARSELPRLIRSLVHATASRLTRVSFPAGESIQRGGPDGVVEALEESPFVPRGISLWEMSTEKSIKAKADSDYRKRARDTEELSRTDASFVFVTARQWSAKGRWASAKRKEGSWRDVRAYDADDLEQWLEMAPGVLAWFSRTIGAQPDGVQALEAAWEAFIHRTDPPLSRELLTAGREKEAEEVRLWMRSLPSVRSIQAHSADEAVAFLMAAILELPEEEQVALTSRTVVVESPNSFRQVIHTRKPLILVPTFSDPALFNQAVGRNHNVILPLDSGSNPTRETLRLSTPTTEEWKGVLEKWGLHRDRAERLAERSRGHIPILIRCLNPLASVPRSAWAAPKNAPSLIPALLAGAWDESLVADKTVLARLASRRYEEVEETLKQWQREVESPIQKIGRRWQWVSHADAWFLLGSYVNDTDIERFQQTVLEVLGSLDPRYDLPPDERHLAAVQGKVAAHSPSVRQGLVETLAMMAVSETAEGKIVAQHAAPIVVAKLLRTDDWRLWASVSPLLPDLAEAAPDAFLDAVEEVVIPNPTVIGNLFREGGIFGMDSAHSHLLWALETLAWSPTYLSRAALSLAELAKRDPGGKLANRPIRSLREIFLGWCPQTMATLPERMQVIDRLAMKNPEVAWELCLDLLIEWGGATAFPTRRPRWQEWHLGWEAQRYTDDFWPTVEAAGKRLLAWVGTDTSRWIDLLPKLNSLLRLHSARAVEELSSLDVSKISDEKRLQLHEAIRQVLHHHRQFPDANWALPSKLLDSLDSVYTRLEPEDAVRRFAFLFSSNPGLPRPEKSGWEEEQKDLENARVEAVRTIVSLRGVDGILDLARAAEPGHAHLVGWSTAEAGLRQPETKELLDRTLGSNERNVSRTGIALVEALFHRDQWEWVSAMMSTGPGRGWNERQRLDFACGLPFEGRTWDLVVSWGKSLSEAYWREVGAGLVRNPQNDAKRALESLLAADRPYDALRVAAYAVHGDQTPPPVSSDMLARVLERLLTAPSPGQAAARTSMVQYEVEKVLHAIERADDLDQQRVIRLEWMLLPVLRWSERGPEALHRALATAPTFFAEVLSAVYKAQNTDEEPDNPESPEIREANFRRGWDLLRSWKTVPGRREDGSFDSQRLNTWVMAARDACAKIGRAKICDDQIGQVLAYSSIGSDGSWPHEAVRDLIEELDSRDIERGFFVGILNLRGVFSRSLGEGGVQERELATRYRSHANAIKHRWPMTAKVLRSAAESYEADAQREDSEAGAGR